VCGPHVRVSPQSPAGSSSLRKLATGIAAAPHRHSADCTSPVGHPRYRTVHTHLLAPGRPLTHRTHLPLPPTTSSVWPPLRSIPRHVRTSDLRTKEPPQPATPSRLPPACHWPATVVSPHTRAPVTHVRTTPVSHTFKRGTLTTYLKPSPPIFLSGKPPLPCHYMFFCHAPLTVLLIISLSSCAGLEDGPHPGAAPRPLSSHCAPLLWRETVSPPVSAALLRHCVIPVRHRLAHLARRLCHASVEFVAMTTPSLGHRWLATICFMLERTLMPPWPLSSVAHVPTQ
jgi:hypothetical protein